MKLIGRFLLKGKGITAVNDMQGRVYTVDREKEKLRILGMYLMERNFVFGQTGPTPNNANKPSPIFHGNKNKGMKGSALNSRYKSDENGRSKSD